MNIYGMVAAILPLKKRRNKMSRLECPICGNAGDVNVQIGREKQNTEFEFLGMISCGPIDKHSFPSRFVAGSGRVNDIGILPAPHSVDALGAKVESAKNKTVRDVLAVERKDLIQDITEACAAKQWELYKSSVVMCRRLVQVPLAESLSALEKEDVERAIEKARSKWDSSDLSHLTLGPLLAIERNLTPPLLSAYHHEQANRIKEAGDAGAHREVELEPDFVDGNIREAAIIAATLVHQMGEKRTTGTASQSRPDNSAP